MPARGGLLAMSNSMTEESHVPCSGVGIPVHFGALTLKSPCDPCLWVCGRRVLPSHVRLKMVRSRRPPEQLAFLGLALVILATSLVGWLYIFLYGLVFRAEAPAWASPLTEASSAVALALFGTLLGIKEARLHIPTPQIDVEIVRQDVEQVAEEAEWMNLKISSTVSIHPGQAPITIRTFKGVIEPLWEGASTLSQPILLKPNPAPLEASVESFSYVATFVPRPPARDALRLSFFLVTDDGTTAHVVKVTREGGWHEPGWRERRRDARWLRRRERERRRGRGVFPN